MSGLRKKYRVSDFRKERGTFASMIVFFLLSLTFSASTYALPALQLDIIGGEYETSTETIVSTGDEFSLVAYGRVSKIDLTEQHFISIAVTPKIGPDPVDFGSFEFQGTNYDINDLIYGTPPVESGDATTDGGDLGGHGIFETFFLEIGFFFDASQTVAGVNTQDNPGSDPTDAANAGNDLYYVVFDGNISGLFEGFSLHFDLYNTRLRENGDYDIDNFAPFSHDAEVRVPEPDPLFILISGMVLLLTASYRRRILFKQKSS